MDKPKIICTLRDPNERLLSHIRYDARSGISFEGIKANIEEENSRYDNLIHKYIFDYNLSGTSHYSHSGRNQFDSYNHLDSIDFVDFSDENSISNIKSSFLSLSALPNIIQYSRLNDSYN